MEKLIESVSESLEANRMQWNLLQVAKNERRRLSKSFYT